MTGLLNLRSLLSFQSGYSANLSSRLKGLFDALTRTLPVVYCLLDSSKQPCRARTHLSESKLFKAAPKMLSNTYSSIVQMESFKKVLRPAKGLEEILAILNSRNNQQYAHYEPSLASFNVDAKPLRQILDDRNSEAAFLARLSNDVPLPVGLRLYNFFIV